MNTLSEAIKNFLPTPTQKVTVLLLTKGGDHFVGLAQDIDPEPKTEPARQLTVTWQWMIQVTRIKNGPSEWRPVPQSKEEQYVMPFANATTRSEKDGVLKIRVDGDTLLLSVNAEGLIQAGEILHNYSDTS